MNVICSTIEAVTATTQLIGTIIGSSSIIWSHCSGIYHMICGPILGGSGGTFFGGSCGTITACAQDFVTSIIGSPLGQIIYGAISGWGPK